MTGRAVRILRGRRSARGGEGTDAGYAMLAALVATALGLTLALAAFAMAEVAARVTDRDAAAERARGAAQAGVAEVAERLAWGGLPSLWGGAGEESFERRYADRSHASVTVSAATAADGSREFAVRADGRAGSACCGLQTVLRVEADRFPVGLTVAEDLLADDRLTIQGISAHVGGEVYGGEHIVVDQGSGEAGSVVTGAAVGWPPSREWLACLGSHAAGGLSNADEAVLDLGALAETVAALPAPAAPLTGHIVVVRPAGGELLLRGWWPLVDERPQLTLIVDGDVRLGGPPPDASAGAAGSPAPADDAVALRGALLATGDVSVESTAVVAGFLAARRLHVRAALTVILSADWRDSPPPGSLRVLRRSEGRRTESTGERPPEGGRSAMLTPSSRIMNIGRMHVVRGLPARFRPEERKERRYCLKLCSIPADVCAGEPKGRRVRGV